MNTSEKITPLVSIIVPVYNTEKYLKQCLDSIINQTFKDIEIICVDDCSTDSSPDILKEYQKKDERIKIIELFENSKQGKARNEGLKIAKGKYIAFVDSDDLINKEMIRKQYEKITQYDVDFILSEASNFYEGEDDENLKVLYNQNEIYNNTTEYIEGEHFFDFKTAQDIRIGPVAKLYKKSIIDEYKIAFPEKLIEEDIAFHFLYMMRVNSIYSMNEQLYYRRVHNDSTIYKLEVKNKNKADNIYVLKFVCKYLKEHTLYKEYKNKFLQYVEKSIISIKKDGSLFDLFNLILCSPLDILQTVFYINICIPAIIKRQLRENKHKKVAFWGASLFLEKFLSKHKIKYKNVIGIIDKNPEKWDKTLCGYEINSPEKLLKEADIILFSIQNNSRNIYPKIKKELETNYHKVELLENMFDRFQ